MMWLTFDTDGNHATFREQDVSGARTAQVGATWTVTVYLTGGQAVDVIETTDEHEARRAYEAFLPFRGLGS